ncbi:hypothetical protein JG687_00008063 [Phytophthora cactorum]|uniref:Elicitin n=1 Tax=Phytophthora cactorum TaxID=29920 RepID=A0A8T1UI11_9STRA|nr:hypothetical protein PC120_g11307 [Phytophthora cactorum]KAG3061593.1 hypothetical protein PC121_g12928 [Phytophthora cactorum]KAG3182487.1 hypothetical protein PC128_g14656 [Phytophthora cactorum]KAG4052578.1 hypothetical protein PC123_g12250 [Phytophthora cactorum]KAG6960749.1 hypothetical protein JG687_00008063 [Phytophthora cactorum]
MKISMLFLSVAIATSSLVLVFAEECTTDDLTTISDIYSSAMADGTSSACPDLTSANDATSTDYCTSDCVEFMTGMLGELPDCSTGGVNIKAGLQAAIDYCETGTANTSDVLTGSGTSSLRSGSSTSSKADSITGDKVTGNTVPPATGSSTASSIGITLSSVVVAVVAFIGA